MDYSIANGNGHRNGAVNGHGPQAGQREPQRREHGCDGGCRFFQCRVQLARPRCRRSLTEPEQIAGRVPVIEFLPYSRLQPRGLGLDIAQHDW